MEDKIIETYMIKDNIEEEIWKSIKDYEGYYEVSSLGRVRSIERTIVKNDGRVTTYKERIIKPHKNN